MMFFGVSSFGLLQEVKHMNSWVKGLVINLACINPFFIASAVFRDTEMLQDDVRD